MISFERLSKFLPKKRRAEPVARATRSAPAAAGPRAANSDAGIVPESVIAKVRSLSRLDLLAATMADRARWFVAFLALAVITLFSAYGWHVADQRFADNVRVAWVKLDPSGAYTVEFADDVRPVEFFQNTLESKLTEFIEKRYRKNAATIVADYRYVGLYLSPQLSTKFLSRDEYNAARVAAEMRECQAHCVERDVRVRVVQHRNRIALRIPERRDAALYETLMFVTFIDRRPDVAVLDRRNAIIQMAWRIKGKSEIAANKAALIVNPLGIEVMSLDLKEDPTPVSTDARVTPIS